MFLFLFLSICVSHELLGQKNVNVIRSSQNKLSKSCAEKKKKRASSRAMNSASKEFLAVSRKQLCEAILVILAPSTR